MCKPGAGCCGSHGGSGISLGPVLGVLGATWAAVEVWAAIEASIAIVFAVAVVVTVVAAPLLIRFTVSNARRPGLQFSPPAALLRTPLFQAQIEDRNAWRARHGGVPVEVPAIPAPQRRALPASPAQRPGLPAPAPRLVWAEITDALPVSRRSLGGSDG